MKAWTFILFFICLNIACNVVAYLVAADVFVPMTNTQSPYSNSNIMSMFSLTAFSAGNILTGTVAGIAGLIGLITKQGIFAIIAALIFVVGLFAGIGNWIFNGIGTFAGTMLAGTGLEWLGTILQVVTLCFFFLFLASILAQRQDFP